MEALLDEVESLEAILMEDVRIERDENGIPTLIETTVFPLLGENSGQQYVCVTLQVLPPNGYPDVSPDFKLLRPRGLDDGRLETIKEACEMKIQEAIGFPVVFDLIEVVREHLTGSNLPSGQCVVCLYGFCDGDEFIRTECFHYLHSYCLARHINAMRCNYGEEYNKLPAWQQKSAPPFQPLCPVCREPIKDESDRLRCAMPPSDLENAPDFTPTQELRELQQRMSALFLEQKNRGAIIDADTEGAVVISIETEEEINRRIRRRREETPSIDEASSNNSCNNHHLSGTNITSNNFNLNSSCPQETAPLSEQHKNNVGSGGGNATKMMATVQQTSRTSNEPTNNNNYHHHHYGKRFMKGGRRHHHHHQYQQTQRDRERFQHHHIPSTSTCSSSSNSTTTSTTTTTKTSVTSHSSTSQSTQSNINKPTRGHISGSNAHNR